MKGIWLLDAGEWLKDFDPDGGDPEVSYPTGTFKTTADPVQALAFEDFKTAMTFWKLQSQRTPFRPDGLPNRPLTAFSIVVKDLES